MYQAGVRHLTPVTLELGGKCPVIVAEDARLWHAAKRVAWGSFLNAGQTCVRADYVLVHEKVGERFVGMLRRAIREMYGPSPEQSEWFGRIVHERVREGIHPRPAARARLEHAHAPPSGL